MKPMRALALATVMAAAVLLTAVVAAVTPVVLMVVVVSVTPMAVGQQIQYTKKLFHIYRGSQESFLGCENFQAS